MLFRHDFFSTSNHYFQANEQNMFLIDWIPGGIYAGIIESSNERRHSMMQQTVSPGKWDTRRQEKRNRISRTKLAGKVLPSGDLPAMLEKLIAPGDRSFWKETTRNRLIFWPVCWHRPIPAKCTICT